VIYLFAALGSFFFMAERLFALRPNQGIFRRGFWADIFYIPIHFFMRVFVNGTLAVAISEIGHHFLPVTTFNILQDKHLFVQVLAVLFILDFIFYVTHRLKHRWNWWWRLHETHHSSVEMDFLSSARFHPVEKLLDRTIYVFPLLFLGVSETAILIWAGFDVFFGMMSHSNLNWRIGPLIYIFVGPEMHRWHHVKDPQIRECNYGNNFSIFDWIFGTAYVSYNVPGEYGVEEVNFPHNNIVKQFFFAFRPSSLPEQRQPSTLGEMDPASTKS
jgi:sterol desaturase/sphingolipid hydroxylase (fatty acid hydroxylase superfamily)